MTNNTDKLRLLTYNVHGYIGQRGSYDPDRILRVIADSGADLVLLQEVHEDPHSSPSPFSRLQSLPQYPHHHYFPTTESNARGRYGNLVLSKWPLESVEDRSLNVAGREPRGAILATVSHPSGPIDLAATHLGLKRFERVFQVLKLLVALRTERPARHHLRILAGDLNEWLAGSLPLRLLQAEFGHLPALATFPSAWPMLALDRVFAKPRRKLSSLRTLQSPDARIASDHLPLLAEFKLRQTQPSPVI